VDRLLAVLRDWYWQPGRKVLLCAQDVADALGRTGGEVIKGYDQEISLAAGLTSFLAIEVTVTPDSAPGTWSLVRHDKCTVDAPDGDYSRAVVRHRECRVVAANPAVSLR
jgi:hypothetical protein